MAKFDFDKPVYRWNADTQDFDIEDAIQDMIFADFPVS